MKFLLKYAFSFLGTPYIWGGDDPSGFDCSGFVQEIIIANGIKLPHDFTANGLYHHILDTKQAEKSVPQPGALLFFGTKLKITHVAIAIDELRMIEAGGGDSRTRTVNDANKQNAFIRIRPISNRSDLVEILRPNYLFY